MSGSWEILAGKKVLTGILHVETTTMPWSLGFRHLYLPGPVMPVSGLPFCHARNSICQAALEQGFEHVFFLDSDVIPPPDAVPRLLARNLGVVSGLYCRRSPPAGVPVMQKPPGQWVTQFEPGSLVDVDTVGAGCLLIHRRILEGLAAKMPADNPRKWFEWRVDFNGRAPREECMSEDFEMCRRVRTLLGEKIWVDTSIVCRHIGLAEATYGNFAPPGAIPVG